MFNKFLKQLVQYYVKGKKTMMPYCPNNSNFTFREIVCLPCGNHKKHHCDNHNFGTNNLFDGYIWQNSMLPFYPPQHEISPPINCRPTPIIPNCYSSRCNNLQTIALLFLLLNNK